jgi:XTP/dITP diphosphohydrolase
LKARPKLLIATNNAGKVDEFRDIMAESGWEVVSPVDVGVSLEPEETGSTYRENATIKARAFSEASGLAALADDSGLEVDALDGEPGPLHHQRGWDGVDREDRIAILLRALDDVPPERRTARFRAVLVVMLPGGETIVEDGTVEGTIATEPVGDTGFGYDPVFLLPGRSLTMAQLSPEEKNRVSHRAVAAEKMRERLRQLAATTEEASS